LSPGAERIEFLERIKICEAGKMIIEARIGDSDAGH
jgi:hypothetical protein